MDSDIQLIQRCVHHEDVRAFEILVERHQSALRYSLRQLTGWDPELADDLAQSTFIKAYAGLRSFRADAKFSTWLYRIAYNEFVSHSRKQGYNNTEEIEDLDRLTFSEDVGSDLHRDLARAMLQLSEEQRVALHLILHRQCTQQEVAEIMGCPLGTVKSHILRGKEKLQIVLVDWREDILI